MAQLEGGTEALKSAPPFPCVEAVQAGVDRIRADVERARGGEQFGDLFTTTRSKAKGSHGEKILQSTLPWVSGVRCQPFKKTCLPET